MSGLRLYLYGEDIPEVSSLTRDPVFRGVVRELISDGRVSATPESSPVIERAVHGGLLAPQGETWESGPRLMVVPAAAERGLPDRLRPVLAHYVEIAGDVAAELAEAYAATAAARLFDWRQVDHTFVAGMFLDLAMGGELIRCGQIGRSPVGDAVVWAFETVSARNAFGIQASLAAERRALFAQIWHRDVRRDPLRMSPAVVERIAELAAGEPVSPTSPEMLYLRHLKLARRSDAGFQLQAPFFGPADTERLLPILTRGARRLVEDAVVPALDLVAQVPWWRERSGQEPFRHAAVRLILEYGTDCVIASRVLAPFPAGEEPAAAWGRWGWEEPDTDLTLMPALLARQEAAPRP